MATKGLKPYKVVVPKTPKTKIYKLKLPKITKNSTGIKSLRPRVGAATKTAMGMFGGKSLI